MIASISFGDIFRHEEKEYIFLAKTENIIYAAEILSTEKTERIDVLLQKRINLSKDGIIDDCILYCYVVLQTEQFKNRCAHFAHSGKDDFKFIFDKLSFCLEKKDLRSIKDEIMIKRSIPPELKELVKNIKI